MELDRNYQVSNVASAAEEDVERNYSEPGERRGRKAGKEEEERVRRGLMKRER